SFFFQAEDGIRDSSVTGVQTCALPISARGDRDGARVRADREVGRWRRRAAAGQLERADPGTPVERAARGDVLVRVPERAVIGGEIGRASCRERVWATGAEGS